MLMRAGPSSPLLWKRGFTLVELIVVFLVVAVLTALAFPVFNRVAQGSKAAACISNLRQIGAGLSLYLGEHNMVMPTMSAGRSDSQEQLAVLDTTLSSQITDARVFACPADRQGIAAKSGTSYYWNSALNGQAASSLNFLGNADSTRIPIVFDKAAFHPYLPLEVNMLYADGHATRDFNFKAGAKQ